MQKDVQQFVVFDASVQDERAQWLALWQTWPQRDVVAHPGYAELFARPGDRTVCAAQITDNGGILFPFIVRPLRTESWAGDTEACDLVSPYGYGGPFGWGGHSAEAFWAGFDKWACAVRAVSLFARFSLFRDRLIPFYGDTLVKGPAVVVLLDRTPEAILASYDKDARKNVRQAERAGVTIEPDPDCRRLNEFLDIYYETMDRLEARSMYYFPKEFFESLIANAQGQVMLFHALHGGRVVSTEILLVSADYLYAFLTGTVEEGMQVRANPLLRHAVNVWGQAHGKRYLVLGGGYESAVDSLYRYKLRYAPDSQASFSVGTRVLDSLSYQKLIDQRAAWESEQGRDWSPAAGFFPAYRG